MIVGEYEQWAVYKYHNVVSNGPDNGLETYGAMFNPKNMLSKVLRKSIFTIIFKIRAYIWFDLLVDILCWYA